MTTELGPLFSDASLAFLRGLAEHNEKSWFDEHRSEYEGYVRAPMRVLVEEMDQQLVRMCPELVGDVKRSIFRINRDTRFSKNKTPYRSHVACRFNHRLAISDHHGSAGFYFHLQPGNSIVGGGLWMPAPPALKQLRAAIASDTSTIARIARDDAFVQRFGGLNEGGKMKRLPRGVTEDDPAAEWLRFQSFVAMRPLTDAEVTSVGLVERLAKDFALILPLVRWLNGTLGFPPQDAR